MQAAQFCLWDVWATPTNKQKSNGDYFSRHYFFYSQEQRFTCSTSRALKQLRYGRHP